VEQVALMAEEIELFRSLLDDREDFRLPEIERR
jgi:hypothetical protein